MKFIKKIKGAKNAEVSLVEIDGKYWVHKKEDLDSSINEKAFQQLLKKLDLPYLEILEEIDLPDDEIVMEYVVDSPTLDTVETVEGYRKWGEVLSKLHAHTSDKLTILTVNGKKELDVNEEIRREMDLAEERLKLSGKFSENEIALVMKTINRGFDGITLSHCTVHGDMHQANVLVRDGELVLFDKSPMQWSFSPLLDIAIVLINTPNGVLIDVDEKDCQNDKKLWNAFLEGYGLVDMDGLKLFCLLEASRRVNNKFEKFNPEIVRNLANLN
jgi:tRNA A-37 threonylcarbamoyl transferase component Bud32